MKIAPAFAPAPAPAPAVGKPVGIAFGVLMESANPLDDGSRAAGFQARGMFGRHGAVDAAASATKHPDATPLAPSPAASPDPNPGPDLQAPSPEGPGRATTPASPPRAAVAAIHDPAPGPGPTGGDRADPGVTPAMSRPDPAASGEGPEPGGPRLRRTRLPSPHQPGHVSLGKADEAGTASLMVRAMGLDPEEIAEFRARAETLLRERGLALDKVRINGEDHPAVVPPGGRSKWP